MPIGRGVIPHDLAYLAAEAHFGIEDGFWGLLARGATFKRGTAQRPTRRGRALMADNRSGLHAAERLGNARSTGSDGRRAVARSLGPSEGLRNRDPGRNRYRSSMYRLGLVFLGIGLAAALLVGIVVAILK